MGAKMRKESWVGRSVDQFKRELYLTGTAGGLADLTEAGAGEYVGGRTHVDDIEEVEELAAELEVHKFSSAPPPAEGRAFDEREIVVIKGRPSKGIATQSSEAALVGARAASHVDGDGEVVHCIVDAFAKVILTVLARGGEMRLGDLVGPIDAIGAGAGLLDA